MEQGWIKLHRKLLDNPVCKKPTYAWLWVYLLLKANHKPSKFMWNGEVIIIKDGQLLIGRKKLSIETGIPESTIEDILKMLEKQQQIRQQKTTKFRVITILNWHTHQKDDIKSNNKATTKQQQSDTYKNEKNEENEEKELATPSVAEAKINLSPLIEKFKPLNPSYERLFPNKTERAALERMLAKFGYEELAKMIDFLPQIVSKPYAPRITTPYEMEKNLGKIKIFLLQEQGKVVKKKIEII